MANLVLNDLDSSMRAAIVQVAGVWSLEDAKSIHRGGDCDVSTQAQEYFPAALEKVLDLMPDALSSLGVKQTKP